MHVSNGFPLKLTSSRPALNPLHSTKSATGVFDPASALPAPAFRAQKALFAAQKAASTPV